MKKHMLTIGALGFGALLGFILADKEKRSIFKNYAEDMMYTIKNLNTKKNHSLLEDAGIPDQVGNGDHAQMENAKMVSEGSQYGVNYYNHVQEEKLKS